MTMSKRKLLPPDGGWGWAIMLAYALFSFIYIPVMQNFGMIFKDTFKTTGFSAADGTLIMSTNSALGMLMGLVNGPLLRRFSYRKVSLAASVFMVIGVISTAYSRTFIHYIITYGVITSIGIGMGMSSYPLAMNSYFLKRRSKATGLAFTLSGLGPILMPQLISLLLSLYGPNGAIFIIGGISLNTFVSALLLHPVKWYMKHELDENISNNAVNDKEVKELNRQATALLEKDANNSIQFLRETSPIEPNDTSISETQYGFEAPPLTRHNSTSAILEAKIRRSSISDRKRESKKDLWWSWHSINSADLENFEKVAEGNESAPTTIKNGPEERTLLNENGNNVVISSPVYDFELSAKQPNKESKPKRFLGRLVNFFDLSLMQDPVYVNITLGMAVAIFAELNFSILTPFILGDIGLDTQEIATFLSSLSIADLIFRFVAPFVGDYFKTTSRIMYMISLVMLVTTRFTILYFTSFGALIGVAVGLGIAKGVRTVYWTLVVPDYVPIERLAAASGLQMMLNGIFLLILGPVLGAIRDQTGSFVNCIYLMNSLTILTLVMWVPEMLYCKLKSRKEKHEIATENG